VLEIAPYDHDWPRNFDAEAEALRASLGRLIARIEHVGSTSIPGLASKPIIDIQISVDSLDPLKPFSARLASVGYVHVPDPDPGFERVYPHFRKPAAGPATHHVHLCVSGSEMERRHLAFRDYLRDHMDAAQQYALLKRSLAAAHGLTTRDDLLAYTSAKGPFIESVIKRAIDAGYPKS
jgi:GrpB-like predicted nucleotidyltransferase (UPF0157 family)